MRQIFQKLAFLGFVFLAIPPVTYADGPKIWFENSGGLSRDHLTNGKITVEQGFFGGYDLEDLVKDNPVALELTKRQSKMSTYAHLSYWLGVIPSSGFFGYGVGSRDTTMTLISAVTLLGTALLTGHFVSESRHSMHEAINAYNGVKRPSEAQTQQISMSGYSSQVSALESHSVSISFSF